MRTRVASDKTLAKYISLAVKLIKINVESGAMIILKIWCNGKHIQLLICKTDDVC